MTATAMPIGYAQEEGNPLVWSGRSVVAVVVSVLAVMCSVPLVALAPSHPHLLPPKFATGAAGRLERKFSSTGGVVPATEAPLGGGFVSNAAYATFAWGPPSRTAAQAADAAFPGGAGWQPTAFTEGEGTARSLAEVVEWVQADLLGGPDPFALFGNRVPVPHTAPDAQGGRFSTPRDQLEPGQWAGYSRRQVCYIVAKSLVGSKTKGYENGLERFMHKDVYGKCTAAAGDFGRAWWTLLAACAADPGLANGAQGPLLLAAKAKAEPPMETVRASAAAAPLEGAGLRACAYGDGGDGAPVPGISPVPAEGCAQQAKGAPGADFMSDRMRGQAVQDISASFLGGYIYGNVCDLGGGQDERLMVYYPEVSALTFFLSEAGPDGTYGPPQLRQPAWILGARRVRTGIDGTCKFEKSFEVDPQVPMTSDLLDVQLNGDSFKLSGSKPFLAFMSENQGFLGWPEAATALGLARRNREPRQREVGRGSKFAFERQVRAWYRAVALTSYDAPLHPVLRAVVTSVGVGPWGAGLWWGDSQLSFLASWIGHAAGSATWGPSGVSGGPALPLDYYLYSTFTENPGNQCLVHSSARCLACVAECERAAVGMQHAFWLPGTAFQKQGDPNPCAATSEDCGHSGIAEVAGRWGGGTANELWDAVEAVLSAAHGKPITRSVFDLMFEKQSAAVS